MRPLTVEQYNQKRISEGKLPRRKLSKSDVDMIKRSLNLRITDPLPKCFARNKKYVRNYEMIGDHSHSLDGHRCHLCQCQITAGYGTDHYGYGLCYHHERGVWGHMQRKKLAEDHKVALQQNNPTMHLTAEKHVDYLDLEGKKAERLANQMNMLPEAETVKLQVQSFYKLMSEWEANDGFRKEAMDKISTIAAKSEITQADRETLEEIRNKMVFPLTERGGKEMSGEVRFKLLTSTLKDLVESMKTLQEILDHDSITFEAFKVWMSRIVEQMKKEFEEQTYKSKEYNVDYRIIEGVAECFRRAGDPRRGK